MIASLDFTVPSKRLEGFRNAARACCWRWNFWRWFLVSSACTIFWSTTYMRRSCGVVGQGCVASFFSGWSILLARHSLRRDSQQQVISSFFSSAEIEQKNDARVVGIKARFKRTQRAGSGIHHAPPAAALSRSPHRCQTTTAAAAVNSRAAGCQISLSQLVQNTVGRKKFTQRNNSLIFFWSIAIIH